MQELFPQRRLCSNLNGIRSKHIESRRTKAYEATAEELQVLDEAEHSGTATEEDVEAAFRSFRR